MDFSFIQPSRAPLRGAGRRNRHRFPPTVGIPLMLLLPVLVAGFSGGCTVPQKNLSIQGHPATLPVDAILETATGEVISRDDLMPRLSAASIVYVGESHTNRDHHAIQLAVIRALARQNPDLTIGMEMFDRTYQPILDRWSAGELDEATFLQLTHWYANWRYDYDLYRDVLEYAKEKGLRVVALNVPFHIPPKIRVGGIASLSANDAGYLPATVDTSNARHRAYLEEIYALHAFGRGRGSFDFFYQAQCTWEDGMAEMVAANGGSGKMVVLAGNGHIIKKFGIPDRAFARTAVPFTTIYPVSVGEEAGLDWADYLWATPDQPRPRMPP